MCFGKKMNANLGAFFSLSLFSSALDHSVTVPLWEQKYNSYFLSHIISKDVEEESLENC